MLAMSLDPATLTGVAFYQTDRPEAAIITRSIRLTPKVSSEAKAHEAGRSLLKLIKANGTPDYVCIEEAFKHPAKGKSIHPVVQGNMIAGAYIGLIGLYNIPCETVTPSTWRSAIFGDGRRKGWASADWKKAAKERCKLLDIEIQNADEAEAALIAIYGARCSNFAQQLKYNQAMKESA